MFMLKGTKSKKKKKKQTLQVTNSSPTNPLNVAAILLHIKFHKLTLNKLKTH